MIKFFSFITRKVFFLYIVIFFIAYRFLDYQSVFEISRLKTLNRLVPPSFSGLVQYSQGTEQLKKEDLESYLYYFNKVIEYVPYESDLADAYGMLGFCYYAKGEPHKAIDFYKKAIGLNPHFFWFHYNLGLIYYKQGRYKEAMDSLDHAISSNPGVIVEVLKTSRIYRQVMELSKYSTQNMDIGLKTVYRNAYLLLITMHDARKDYPKMFDYAGVAIEVKLDDDGLFYFYQGLAAYRLKSYNNAIFALQESLRRNQNNADTFYYFGLSLDAVGKKDYAQAFLKQAEVRRRVTQGYSFDPQKVNLKIF